jgi:hypothetical protein
MRTFDKKIKIQKANMLAEKRHIESKGLIYESFHSPDGTPIGVDGNHNTVIPVNEYVESNKYDLSNPSVMDEFYNDLIKVWTKYCGQNPNSFAVSNDNRVMLYNMLKDGTIMDKINQIWSPGTLNLGTHGSEYPTNNPEMMTKHLNSMGITDFELVSKK